MRQKRVLGTWGGIAVSGDGDGSGAASLYRAHVSEAESSSADDGARSHLRLIVLESGKALVGPTELGVSSQRLLFPDMGMYRARVPEAESSSADDGARSRLLLIVLDS